MLLVPLCYVDSDKHINFSLAIYYQIAGSDESYDDSSDNLPMNKQLSSESSASVTEPNSYSAAPCFALWLVLHVSVVSFTCKLPQKLPRVHKS